VEERLVLPMAEIGAPLQEGVGRLMREVVGKLMPLVMNEEVQQLMAVQMAGRTFRVSRG